MEAKEFEVTPIESSPDHNNDDYCML